MARSAAGARLAEVVGLLIGAAGCAILWVAGAVALAVPPGTPAMVAGAVLVVSVRSRWASAVGALLGLLFGVGALVDPDGLQNLLGAAGPAAALGQGARLVGTLTALIAGSIMTFGGDRLSARG